MNLLRMSLILLTPALTCVIAYAQGTPFNYYTGEDDLTTTGPVTTRWVGSSAVCTTGYPGRSVGLAFRFFSSCASPNNSHLDLSSYWNPGPAPPTWVIEASGLAVRNNQNGYLQHYYYAFSECDIPSSTTASSADIIIANDDDYGC